jgi:hypothetical protein
MIPLLKFIRIKLPGWLALFLLTGTVVWGQTVQVARKSVNKTVSASGVNKIVIGSEKADIEVKAWDKAQIQVSIVLTSRHADKSVSQHDLDKVQLVVNKDRRTFYLRDFVLLRNKEEKPESNLKASYIVYAPANIALDVQGAFGAMVISGFHSTVNVKANFSEIKLSGLSGKTELNTSFGKIFGERLEGTLTLSSNYTQVVLKEIEGNLRANTTYGSLQIEPGDELASIDVKSKKTTVELICREWKKYSYAINGSYTKFRLPRDFRVISGTEERQEVSYSGIDRVPVMVHAEFGDLVIR